MVRRKKSNPRTQSSKPPVLEWITAGLGLLIVAAAFGLTVIQAVGGNDNPPDLMLTARNPRSTPNGWIVEVEAHNLGDKTAAAVQIEGRLGEESATAQIDYVPARGEATASLRFEGDPAGGLHLAVLGWSDP